MDKSKDHKLPSFVRIMRKRSNLLVESTFKFLVSEELDTLDLMSLLHQLIVAQDSFIYTDWPEEMLQNLLEELIMSQRPLSPWVSIPFIKPKESLLWPGHKGKLISLKDQFKVKFLMMFRQHFCIPIHRQLFILINQLDKN